MAPPKDRPSPTNIYILPLTDDGAPDVPGGYIYLPPPTDPCYLIRFQIEGTSSICREGSLWVNLPKEGEDFERRKYTEYRYVTALGYSGADSNCRSLTPDFNRNITIDVPVHQAGAYSFYTTYTPLPPFSTEDIATPEPTRTPTHYIDICPRLTLQGSYLPLDAVSLCSVLSKCMGKYPSDWDKHLHGISERGYNMIHFTPLMMRGESNSPYSIYDQHQFDKEVFPNGAKDIGSLVKRMGDEFGMLAMTDVVWNHTANNSKWLEEHPEAGYSCKTAPHLRSAYELDTALLKFSDDMASLGYPTDIHGEDDLVKVIGGVKEHVISTLRLWEFYVLDVEHNTDAVVSAWKKGHVEVPQGTFGDFGSHGIDEVRSWSLKQKVDWLTEHAMTGTDCMGERFRRKVQPKNGAALVSALFGHYSSKQHSAADETAAHETVSKLLDACNVEYYKEYDNDCATIIEQLFNRIKYMRVDENGPRAGPVTKKDPLIESYFTRLPQNSTTKKHHADSLMLVNNGWVWAADAMKDNAGKTSRAYLRREVIVWSDCVKLRYGTGWDDNPFLWDFIAKYTRLMAKYFHGFRIDNCHSTPLHLAQFMLDEARKVNPNLYVVAELFTGSEEMDYKFCKRLGISCLIREAMQAWSTKELSRLIHMHAGVPIGSFETDDVTNTEKGDADKNGYSNGSPPTKREVLRTIKRSPVHALFMDCTHDNEPPAQKRDARDTLPNAALVAMCASATGSVFGYDECYPKLIELVHETRQYTSPYSCLNHIKIGAAEGGIGSIKKLLNQIHVVMGKDEYDETFIHHDSEYITIHRVHPLSRRGYFLIAHTAFPGYGNGNGGFPAVRLPGTRAKAIGSWVYEVDQSSEAKAAASNDSTLKGLPSRVKDVRGVTCEWSEDQTVINVPEKFPPGSVALFETWIPAAEHTEGLDRLVTRGGAEACKDLDLADLNFLLYRCDTEEREASGGADGCYNVPGHGSLIYAGLQGWWSVLQGIVRENNLGHPLCQHLRDGEWALDYCVGRLDRAAKRDHWKRLQAPAQWLRERFDAIRSLPSFLRPRYFCRIIQTLYTAAVDRAIAAMSPDIQHGQKFLHELALVSVQLCGYMDNATLWPHKMSTSLAAGLPHFASDWARCWGRDIMIAVRGLLIATGRHEEAREHILAFASVVKHGMIPNLLNSGKSPRYNSRDSVWFFLQCIQDYCKIVPGGYDILKHKVERRFLPNSDEWFEFDDPKAYSKQSTVEDVIQEILQQHASGISFREYNAGPDLDRQMKGEGFQIDIKVDWSNGIVYGGSQDNCGTWMDKMGESEKANNKGVPGTPRDGAAVEITGMHYSTLKWLHEIHGTGKYKYDSVSRGSGHKAITLGEWAALIKKNFEYCYYVPRTSSEDGSYDVDAKAVNRRGIYKDLHRSGKLYEDYQLRPNFTIAMTVAPDLFDPEKALYALSVCDSVLVAPTGLSTLDPSDLNYRPNYNNDEDSDDFHTAKGRNYHQGPEWLWPRGFFLRALLIFDLQRRRTHAERVESFQQVTRRLRGCMEMIKSSPWAGLTELTNEAGSYCSGSVSGDEFDGGLSA